MSVFVTSRLKAYKLIRCGARQRSSSDSYTMKSDLDISYPSIRLYFLSDVSHHYSSCHAHCKLHTMDPGDYSV
jgi:hypothetical protein